MRHLISDKSSEKYRLDISGLRKNESDQYFKNNALCRTECWAKLNEGLSHKSV